MEKKRSKTQGDLSHNPSCFHCFFFVMYFNAFLWMCISTSHFETEPHTSYRSTHSLTTSTTHISHSHTSQYMHSDPSIYYKSNLYSRCVVTFHVHTTLLLPLVQLCLKQDTADQPALLQIDVQPILQTRDIPHLHTTPNPLMGALKQYCSNKQSWEAPTWRGLQEQQRAANLQEVDKSVELFPKNIKLRRTANYTPNSRSTCQEPCLHSQRCSCTTLRRSPRSATYKMWPRR
ncbi:hypothetical protein M758_UG241200, partial [Ceratodon purpureus]